MLEYLLRTERAKSIESRLTDPATDVHVPSLCDIEVAAALRRSVLHHGLSPRRASEVIDDYLDLPLTTHGHRALLPRVLGLAMSFSSYDAAYVALAEQLDAVLLTADVRLARATRVRTQVAVLVPATGD